MLRALYRSASLRAAVVLGLGGLAFTIANLIFARTLAPDQYGLVSLVIGIVAVAGLTAPVGLDLVIGRRGLPLDAQLRRTILLVAVPVALIASIASTLLYRLEFPLLPIILATTLAAGLMQASGSHFQGRQRFGPATWIVQLSNWTLLFAALVTNVLGIDTAEGACALLALTAGVGGLFAWVLVWRDAPTKSDSPAPRTFIKEALSLLAIHVSNSVFLQLERLLLPPVAGVHALALFGVVAALVGSPFRMLQMAVLFTLIPNLRRAEGIAARRRLLRQETVLVAIVIGAGSVVIWYVAPPLAHWFLSGRYDLSPALMCAALVSGILKLCSAFTTGTVIALSEDKGLRTLSVVSWATIAVSVAAAFAAAPWGLVGVLYGISVGWLVRSVIAAWMAMPHLRRPDARRHAAPFEDRSQMPGAPH